MAFGSSTDFTIAMKLTDDVSGGLGKIGDGFKRMGEKLTQTGKKMTMGLTLPIVGLGAVSLKAAVDFESAFAGIIKTTDGLADNMGNLTDIGEDMKQGFRDLAKEVPLAFDELAAIGELGGQLGIAREGLLDFTRVIAAMGVATNMTTEEAATGFAQIANVMGTPQDKIENMGSSIVELGNNFATTESDILNFAQRIAGAGKIAGLTESQVFGIGAAFSSVGVQAEAGGMAVQKVLLAMTSAVATGDETLDAFGEAMGITGEEFKKAFEEDAAGAFEAFVSSLGEQGDAAIGTLQDLGLQDQRLIRSFLSLAGAGDLLADTLESSEGAWVDNIALSKEADARYGTTASQLDIMKNTFVDLAATIGDQLLPIVQDILEQLKPFIDRFTELDPKVIKVGLAIAGVVAVAGPLLMALGTLITVGGTLISVVFSPLALVIGGIVLALLGLKIAYDKNLGGFKDFVTGILDKLPSLEDLKGMFESFLRNLDLLKTAFIHAGEAPEQLQKALERIFGEELGAIIGGIVEKVQSFGEWIGILVEDFNLVKEAIQKFGLFSEEILGTKVMEIIQTLEETFTQVWEKVSIVINQVIEQVQPMLEQFWAGIKAGVESAAPLIDRFKQLWEALVPFFLILKEIIIGIVTTIVKVVVPVLSAVVVSVVGIIVSLFGGIANAIQPFIETIVGIVDAVVQIFTGLVQMITGILQTIWGLITGNQELISKGTETFVTGIKNLWEGLWTGIKNLVSGLIKTVVALVSGFYESIVKWFTDLYDKIVGQSIIGDLVDGVVEAIKGMGEDAIKLVEWLITNFIEGIQKIYDDAIAIAKKFIDIGSEIVAGIRKGISDAWDAFMSWLGKQWEKIPKWLRDFIGSGSPSTLFAEIGNEIVAGLEMGVLQGMPALMAAVETMMVDTLAVVNEKTVDYRTAGEAIGTAIGEGISNTVEQFVVGTSGIIFRVTDEIIASLNEMGLSLEDAMKNIEDYWRDAGSVFGGPPLGGQLPGWEDLFPPSEPYVPPEAPPLEGTPYIDEFGVPQITEPGVPPPSSALSAYPSMAGANTGGDIYNIYPNYGEPSTPEVTLAQDIKLLQIVAG